MKSRRVVQQTKTSFDRIMVWCAYGYIIIPILLFIWGWLAIGYAFMGTVVLAYGTYLAVLSHKDQGNALILQRSLPYLLGIAAVVIIWVALSGQGGFVYQNYDWHWRNAIFRDLTTHAWPVYYQSTNCALVYYIAYWLPAALIGKIIGGQGGNVALFLWSLLGCLLTCYFIFRYFRRVSLPLLLLFILFSGLDVVGMLMQYLWFHLGGVDSNLWVHATGLDKSLHLEWWATHFQYSSMTTQLYWVFNQALVPWLAFFLLMNTTDLKSVFFLAAVTIPFGPFPFIGLFLIAVFLAVRHLVSEENRLRAFRGLLTLQNVLPPLVILIVFQLYYKSNATASNAGMHWLLFQFGPLERILYLVFCLLEFGVLALLLRKRFAGDGLFAFIVVMLLLIPTFSFGGTADFCMRASIPALCMLFLYTGRYLQELAQQRKLTSPIGIALLVVLLLGSITPLCEIIRPIRFAITAQQISQPADAIGTFEDKEPTKLTNFLSQHPQTSDFFQVLGKPLAP